MTQQIATLARVSREALLCTFEQSSSLLETLKVQKKRKNLKMAQIHFLRLQKHIHIQVHVSESNGNGSKDDLGVLDVAPRPNGIMYQQLDPCTAPPTAAEME